MRAVVITKHGGPGVLEVRERSDPELGPGQVRIAVAAAGVNFADVMARMGLYPDAPKPPCLVGYEVAGTVLELGGGVGGLSHGQRVVAGPIVPDHLLEVQIPPPGLQQLHFGGQPLSLLSGCHLIALGELAPHVSR